MHPTLLIDLARDLHAERLRAAERQRLVQASRPLRESRRHVVGRPSSGVAKQRATLQLDDTTVALMEVAAR